ncbi:hypothetical protein [Schlesneria paludicola]|uniref:hypothetical protein n=1 Tax=Schlesneria paludicola TaxID=360056 RepID=UPI00029AC33E|nr:hypothetical protein [Schlesneria paludicola]
MAGSQGANIHSVDALKDVRAALIKFQERAATALGDLRQKIDRTVSWLELDRPSYWREQELRAFDQVASARVSYETCRLRTVGGRHSDCIEEKKAFEKAKMRMEYVRLKQAAVRKWMVQAGREANEYRARTSTFQRTIENDVPLMIAQLGRMIDAIEAYSETATPMAATAPVVSSAPNSVEPVAPVEPESTDNDTAQPPTAVQNEIHE